MECIFSYICITVYHTKIKQQGDLNRMYFSHTFVLQCITLRLNNREKDRGKDREN